MLQIDRQRKNISGRKNTTETQRTNVGGRKKQKEQKKHSGQKNIGGIKTLIEIRNTFTLNFFFYPTFQ